MDIDDPHRIHADLEKGAAILAEENPEWEMLKSPEPILFVLARQAVASANAWLPGSQIVEPLLRLKKPESKTFNPDGWFGKEITDVRNGKDPISDPIRRWLPFIERSEGQPYSYRFKQEIFDVVSNFDFDAYTVTTDSRRAITNDTPSNVWLVTWNPRKWNWSDFQAELEKSTKGEPVNIRWSFANSGAELGDEVWIGRVGVAPRVIFGHGIVTRKAYDAEHWDVSRAKAKEKTQYVDVSFDELRDPNASNVVTVDELLLHTGDDQEWLPMRSGIRVKASAAKTLRALWNGEEVPKMSSRERSAISSIADEIEAPHVWQALQRIDKDGFPDDAASTGYDLIEGTKRYPPKYVLELAAEFATGTPLDRSTFSGGEKSTAFRILRDLGFHVEPKRIVQDLVTKFLAQSKTTELAVREYPESYRELAIRVSFGKGNIARIPWIAFLADGEQVPSGIYPALLFYREQRVLLLCYGISEENPPDRTWKNIDEYQSVNEWFESKFGVVPDRYGESRVKASYAVDQSPNLDDLAEQVDRMIAEYLDVVGKKSQSQDRTTPPAIHPRLEIRTDLRAAVDSFSSALREANVSFGESHIGLVRAILASLATKPFLILTGLSGSGKTQVAIRLGEWLGSGRLLVAAVRPDWTGSEAVFGYEDGLRKSDGGRAAWAVPPTLEFMLRAARDPQHPYLLLLDEMNLAHVERYFADVLSGMESGQPCLPNVSKEPDGCWRIPVHADAAISLPRNLWIIGTVNVDETTYMFSPKVLDRANVFEFRVATADLIDTAGKPSQCATGNGALVRGLLAIGSGEANLFSLPSELSEVLSGLLRRLHELLSRYGMEFGHRTFYEARRFAALMHHAGATDIEANLDRIVLQRILPRLHGARRRLETPLLALALFARELPTELPPDEKLAPMSPERLGGGIRARLPLTYEKIVRMLRSLRANQFASFAE